MSQGRHRYDYKVTHHGPKFTPKRQPNHLKKLLWTAVILSALLLLMVFSK